MTKKEDYFKTFCNISKAFGATQNQEKLLELIVDSVIESMEAKAACLYLADEVEDVFYPVSQKGLSENYLHANVFHARGLVDGIKKAGYLSFEDATSDPRLEHHEAKKAEGIASILTVPVTVDNEVIGVLSLYTARRRVFDEDEIGFLRALADQGGMAIVQTKLMQQIRENTRLFLDLSSSINSSLDIKQILHILTEQISERMDLKGATIRLVNEDAATLDLVASYGLSETFLNKGPVSATKSAIQALKGKTVVIEDATTDERVQYKKEMQNEGIVTLVAVPIKSKEAVIGVLRLYSGKKRRFTPEDLLLLKTLAHQGALAIQNASLYIRLAEDKKALEEDIWSHRQWF
jgi:GAF domain-containing protein